jgi:hypothetical protein
MYDDRMTVGQLVNSLEFWLKEGHIKRDYLVATGVGPRNKGEESARVEVIRGESIAKIDTNPERPKMIVLLQFDRGDVFAELCDLLHHALHAPLSGEETVDALRDWLGRYHADHPPEPEPPPLSPEEEARNAEAFAKYMREELKKFDKDGNRKEDVRVNKS